MFGLQFMQMKLLLDWRSEKKKKLIFFEGKKEEQPTHEIRRVPTLSSSELPKVLRGAHTREQGAGKGTPERGRVNGRGLIQLPAR